MVILTERCWFHGHFREVQSLMVILAKPSGFVAKIAKMIIRELLCRIDTFGPKLVRISYHQIC